MKKLFLCIFLFLIFLKPTFAQNIVLECIWDAHVKDYTQDNKWKSFDHNQYFKLTIKNKELVIYDYLLKKDWTHFEIKNQNNKYIIATTISNYADGPSADFITYRKKDGYTVYMGSDYEFGLTAQTGYCK
jgi:D-alanyl-D-alanine dipeptidase